MPTMLVMALDIRLDHSIVAVSDWETSNWFYRDILGRSLYRMASRPGLPIGLATLS